MPARASAASRAEGATEVRPCCGIEEALRDALGLRHIPTYEWPVDLA